MCTPAGVYLLPSGRTRLPSNEHGAPVQGRHTEGKTVASPGITVGTGLDHIQDMLRAGLIHRAAEKEGVLGQTPYAAGLMNHHLVFSSGQGEIL